MTKPSIEAYERLLKRHRELVEEVARLKEERNALIKKALVEATEPIPGWVEPSGDQEVRYCETCGKRMVVPGKSATTECSRCLEY